MEAKWIKWILGLLLGSIAIFKIAISLNIDWKEVMAPFNPSVRSEKIGDCVVFIDRDTGKTLNKECVSDSQGIKKEKYDSVPQQKESEDTPNPSSGAAEQYIPGTRTEEYLPGTKECHLLDGEGNLQKIPCEYQPE